MGFLKKELQPGLCVSLRERPPSIFQNTGFGNGKICWTSPGLKLDPPLTPPRENILDQRMIIHQSFLSTPHPPPPKKKKKKKKNTKMVGDGRAKEQANYAPVICIHGPLGAGDIGDIAGLKCRNLTSDVSWQCRGCAGVLISR